MQRASRGNGSLLKWGSVMAAVCLLAVAGTYWGARRQTQSGPGPQSREFPEGVSSAQYDAAADVLRESTGNAPQRSDVISHLAEQAVARGDVKTAIACFREISSFDPQFGHAARLKQGLLQVRLNRVKAAEQSLIEFLKLESRSPRLGAATEKVAVGWLINLFSLQLRFEERQSLLRTMHRRGQLDAQFTLAFCFPDVNHWNVSKAVVKIERFRSEEPENFRLHVALGRYRIKEGCLDEARTILERCHRKRPTDLPASAALLACLHESNHWKRFEEVLAHLPPLDKYEPWLLTAMRGHGHNRAGRFDKAETCFRQLIGRLPAVAEAYFGLAKSLVGPNQLSERRKNLRTANIIARIHSRLGALKHNPEKIVYLIEIAEFAESIELLEQAIIVAELAKRQAPTDARVQRLLSRLQNKPTNP